MMLMTRRGFLGGLAGILAAAAAPAIITKPGILMPVKKLWTPPAWQHFTIIETNPSTTQSLLMSIWLEDERGRRLWTKDFTPPHPLTQGENIFPLPVTDNSRLVRINATWTEG